MERVAYARASDRNLWILDADKGLPFLEKENNKS
jgi:hypothetical protein